MVLSLTLGQLNSGSCSALKVLPVRVRDNSTAFYVRWHLVDIPTEIDVRSLERDRQMTSLPSRPHRSLLKSVILGEALVANIGLVAAMGLNRSDFKKIRSRAEV